MGLKNLGQQLNLIANANRDVEDIKKYANGIKTLVSNLDSSWVGSEDKRIILSLMNECIDEAVSIANNYYIFSFNAKRWLYEMDKLDKITKAISYVNYVSISIPNIGILRNSKFSIKPNELVGYADKMIELGNQLNSAHIGAVRVFGGIDTLIISRFPGSYKGVGIYGRLSVLEQKNNKIANNIKAIAKIYKNADSKIISKMDDGVKTGKGQSESSVNKKSSKMKDTTKVNESYDILYPIDKLIEREVKSKTLQEILKDLTGEGILGDVKDAQELMYYIEHKEYKDMLKLMAKKCIGKVTGEDGFNTGNAKLKSLVIILDLTLSDDSYLQKNYDKYMLPEGGMDHFNSDITKLAMGVIQVTGKGTVDTACRLIDSVLQEGPAGKVINYTNAISEDLFGTSPGKMFNKMTKGISDAVDKYCDTEVAIAQERDKLIKKIINDVKDGKGGVTKAIGKDIKSSITNSIDIISGTVDDTPSYGAGTGGGGGVSAW